jgi:multidrug transporter EmrE-like cation transporter
LAPFLAIAGAVSLINVVFNVKAFNLLATKSEVPLFRTAAIVLLAGALLSLAIGIVFAVLASSGSASLNTIDCGDSWRNNARHRVGAFGNIVL